MAVIILLIYTLALMVIFLYSIAQLQLVLNYLKARKQVADQQTFDFRNHAEIPFVTIQLPLYNELYVVERLLKNIAEIDYPPGKLEIQVLDDSTDESGKKIQTIVQQLRENGLDIQHITRNHRRGFKAGALKEGFRTAKGEFIAIFDSDFLPGKNWLLQTVPYFKDPEIGVVQTRWAHINRDYSLLTKIQAFALDFHFILEQTGRNFGNYFINFNGTAGIWRKECILDAGDWSGDTLTEDLDLSYRAQLKKWKFKYLENVETPAELPVALSAARSQQFRWNKGAAENFRKNFKKLLKDKSLPFSIKFHAFFHLLNSSMFLVILVLAVLSIPMLYVKNTLPNFDWYFNFLAFFMISTLIFFFGYYLTYAKMHGKNLRSFLNFIGMFLTFFSVAMGFSVQNSFAVLEGHLGKRSEFIRTPKFNISSLNDSWKNNRYLQEKLSLSHSIEFVLWLYFGFGLYSAFMLQDFSLALFHLMLFSGFGFVLVRSIN